MVRLNMTMLSSMSVLLGSMRSGDGESHQVQESHMSYGGDMSDAGGMSHGGDMSDDGNMACGCGGCMNPSCCCKMKHHEEPHCGCGGCDHPKCCCKMRSCRCPSHHNHHNKPCGCKGCNRHDCCCRKQLCCYDSPEVWIDPFEGISTDDENLAILLNLQWPLKDVKWHFDGLSEILNMISPTTRSKRNAKEKAKGLPNANHHSRKRRSTMLDDAVELTMAEIEFKPVLVKEMAATIKNLSSTASLNITEDKISAIESLLSSLTDGSSSGAESEVISSSAIIDGFKENSIIESSTDLASFLPIFASSTVEAEGAGTAEQGLTAFKEVLAMSLSANRSTSDTVEILEFAADAKLSSVISLSQQDTSEAQKQALAVGEQALEERRVLEDNIRAQNITFEPGHPSLMHQMGFKRTDELSLKISQLGIITESATKDFADRFSLPSSSLAGLEILGDIVGSEELTAEFQRPIFWRCDRCNPYRNIDGTCNNLFHWSTWGVAFTPYRRDLPAVYSDGISAFRQSVLTGPLPSARLISTTVNRKPNEESQSFSILHMSFGQFLDHDLAATPLSLGMYGGAAMCCLRHFTMEEGMLPDDVAQQQARVPNFFPDCAPIDIPADDPFYRCHGETCMEFVRSAPAGQRRFQPRNQINQHTAYIDGSVIYGVTPSQVNDVRSFVNGQLKVQLVHANEELLPREPDPFNPCHFGQTQSCFRAGDGRVNEQILLTFLHTLFAREHNRIASSLKDCNPHWDDEKLFQETRRIIGAELQQVTYNEFVPTFIGPSLMTHSNLYPLVGSQQTTDYDPYMNAAIANEFAAAAYRFGHSQISDVLLNVNKHGVVKPKELNSYFFHPFELYNKHGVCDIGRGGTVLPDRLVDPYFTPEVSGKLFRGQKPWGLDLLAINIQRGRDHGLASYNSWRVKCGLPRAWWFGGLLGQMTQERVDALQSVYRHVDDIDLYVGGLSETPIPGGMMGPTFTCLLHSQFLRIKRGDRYWFEYKHSPGRFTTAQMEQLHNVTLAGIMCNNLPELDYVQRWPLKQPGPDNPVVCCKNIRQYNLDPWNEECMVNDRDPYVYC